MLRKILPVVVLLVGVGGFLVLKASRTTALPTAAVEKEWLVDSTPAVAKNASPTLRLYGQIDTPSKSRLSSPVTADVLQVFALAGERVKQGDGLVQLDDIDALNTLLQREAELADLDAQILSENKRHAGDIAALKIEREMVRLSERSVARSQKLAKSRAGSEATLDDALNNQQQRSLAVSNRRRTISEHDARLTQLDARKTRAQAALDIAKRDLERTKVIAPFDGRITSVHVSPGSRVRTGDALLELFDTKLIEVKAQVPSSHLGTLRRAWRDGETVKGTASIDDMQIAVNLDRLGGEVSQGSVTAYFKIATAGAANDSNKNSGLELGRTVAVHVSLPAIANVIELPFEAVYGGNVVYRIVDGRIQSVEVQRVGETLRDEGRKLLIRSDQLSNDDQIVTSLLPGAVEGLKVKLAQ